jgi:hypothetical protein
MTDKRPCTRCGSTEPGHRISLECKVIKRTLGDRVVTRVGTEAGVRAGTISRVWSDVQYEVEWDDGHRSITASTGWLEAEPMSRSEANEYYGEGGVNDAAEDQAYLDRQAEEREEL